MRKTMTGGLTAILFAVLAVPASALDFNPALFASSAHAGQHHQFEITANYGFTPQHSYAVQPNQCLHPDWTKTPGTPGCYHRASSNWIQFTYERRTYRTGGIRPVGVYSMNATGENSCFRTWSSQQGTWWFPPGDSPGWGFSTGDRYHGCSAAQYAAKFG